MRTWAFKLGAALGMTRLACSFGRHAAVTVGEFQMGGLKVTMHRCVRCRHFWETTEQLVKVHRCSYEPMQKPRSLSVPRSKQEGA